MAGDFLSLNSFWDPHGSLLYPKNIQIAPDVNGVFWYVFGGSFLPFSGAVDLGDRTVGRTSKIFYVFCPYLGRGSNLTNIILGWVEPSN